MGVWKRRDTLCQARQASVHPNPEVTTELIDAQSFEEEDTTHVCYSKIIYYIDENHSA